LISASRRRRVADLADIFGGHEQRSRNRIYRVRRHRRAIIVFAITVHTHGFNIISAGWILLVVGIVVLLIGDRGLRDRQPEELDNSRECPEHALEDRNGSRSDGTGARPRPTGRIACQDVRWRGGEPESKTCPICGSGTLRTADFGISSPIAVRCKRSRAATRSQASGSGPPTPMGWTWSAASRKRP
jgi:hypothetical protein